MAAAPQELDALISDRNTSVIVFYPCDGGETHSCKLRLCLHQLIDFTTLQLLFSEQTHATDIQALTTVRKPVSFLALQGGLASVSL